MLLIGSWLGYPVNGLRIDRGSGLASKVKEPQGGKPSAQGQSGGWSGLPSTQEGFLKASHFVESRAGSSLFFLAQS